jgi:hypothetical protein
MSLTSAIKTMISKVKIEKLGGDKQSGKIGTMFGEPFVVRVVYETTPVSGAALLFESTDYMHIGDGLTDENGRASFTAHVRMLPGNVLRMRMSLADLSKEFEQNLLSVAALFSFTPHMSDVGFEITVPGKQGQAADALKGRVSTAVSMIGYRVVSSSRYKLELTMRTTPPVKSEGFSGTLTTIKLEAAVSLIDTQAGGSIGAYSTSAMGGGRTEQDAITKAATAVTVDPMKLADLLEKIAQ